MIIAQQKYLWILTPCETCQDLGSVFFGGSRARLNQKWTYSSKEVFDGRNMEISAAASGFETCVSAAWLKAATWFLFWEHGSQCQCLFFTTMHVLKAAKMISLLLLSHTEEKHLPLIAGRWLNMDFWMFAGHTQGSRSCGPLRAAIHQDWTAAVFEHQIFCTTPICSSAQLLMYKARWANNLTTQKHAHQL